MKFLLLTDRFAIAPSATQICAGNLAGELVNRGHETTVVSMGYRDEVYKSESGVTVLSLENGIYKAIFWRQCPNSERSILKKKAFAKMLALRMQLTNWVYTEEYAREVTIPRIEEFLDLDSFDVIVSFSEPFSTHVVGNRIKLALGGAVKWVSYEMDPFALNYNRPAEQEERNRILETELLKDADMIVFADGILEENHKRNHLVEYENKSISVPIPTNVADGQSILDDADDGETKLLNKSSLVFVYTGMFYPRFRSPDPLLRILESVSFEYELHIYGDCDQGPFRKNRHVYKKCVFHGRKDNKICQEACRKADILIDIQNDIPNQIPSKLFSYMMLNKPIVSFYSEGCDLGIRYLKDYQNAICILKSTIREQGTISVFESFCKEDHPPMNEEELQACLEPFSITTVTDTILDALSNT